MTALGEDKLHQFKMSNETNRLQHQKATKFPQNSGPRHLVFHPNYQSLYVIGEYDAVVYQLVYSIKQSKYIIVDQVPMMRDERIAKMAVSSSNNNQAYKAADIKVSKNGRLLFATERRSNSLCSFQISETDDSLTLQSCIDTEAWPRGIQIANSHELVIAAGKQSHHIALYTYDEKGNMTLLSKHKAGKGPNWIEVVEK